MLHSDRGAGCSVLSFGHRPKTRRVSEEGPTQDSLRERLAARIDLALDLSDQLGTGLVGCHLQMARDLLGESLFVEGLAPARPADTPPWPEPEAIGPDGLLDP